MTYRLIATDFDDTLVPLGHQEILPRTKEAIAQARALGAVFALVSGRAIAGLHNIVAKFDIDTQGLYLIGFNGAQIVQAWDDKQLYSQRLDRQTARQVIGVALTYDVTVMIPEGDKVFTNRPDAYSVAFETGHNATTPVRDETLAVTEIDPCKVLIGGEQAELERLAADLQTRFGNQTEVLFSATFLLEVNAAGITKGNALRGLCEAIGIDIAEAVAFGDNYNDVSMLRAAGLGVAMGNAVPDAKEAADMVTADCLDDGIAVALAELGMI